jgi:hypothetical protein
MENMQTTKKPKVKINKTFERDFGNTNLKIWRVHNVEAYPRLKTWDIPTTSRL